MSLNFSQFSLPLPCLLTHYSACLDCWNGSVNTFLTFHLSHSNLYARDNLDQSLITGQWNMPLKFHPCPILYADLQINWIKFSPNMPSVFLELICILCYFCSEMPTLLFSPSPRAVRSGGRSAAERDGGCALPTKGRKVGRKSAPRQRRDAVSGEA